ncbi:TPA: site-specific DNA-methyltransferase [Legionella pneumophila]|nr:site-specific DNA-methyltransferase [Legionella pneumophila]HCC3234138.1 site-specific DNA-methyltransferase [Legionella pneumophila subsp. pneumophila]HDO7799188.1 site-specific DNA-methyltransferase [Legionella pneumophila]HDO7969330.1 site-specific DNA-methyltransferase [Legionella pneumophila]HDO7983681.1 site-specific DNA-methyltransferase [Legionella pneumophila]
MHSKDITEDNIEKIAALFPNCITEATDEQGRLRKKIDFDLLRQELSREIVEGPQERYQLNWPGKRQALLTANAPIAKTLRPCREESVDFDTTQNLFIEGDNLDALKLMQETYLGKIKMIYIDPPYNTGKDFIYKDNFSESTQKYFSDTKQLDEEGNRLIVNVESDGRFHSNWLSMIYSRIKLARNLLTSDGVIFISIDNSEHDNLTKICNEVFGEANFLGVICRATGQTTGQDSGGLGSSFDFLLAYAKDSKFDLSGLPLTPKDLKRFENEDERGKFAYDQMRKTGSNDRREDRPNMFYPVKDPDGNNVYPLAPAGYESCWRFEKKTYERLVKEGYILWKKTKRNDDEIWWPYVKYYLEGRTKRPSPLWNDLEGNKKAARDLRSLFEGKKYFDFPKPIPMIKRLIQISPNASSEDIILDFFAGSSTTAHAVMQLNAEDGGSRKFIMVQLPEPCDEILEAYKAGYKTIAEISKERIRRAGIKIKEENANKEYIEKLDIGFRVLKIDSSNMADVYYTSNTIYQDLLTSHTDNVKPDRTPEDLLFQVLLDWGVDLTLPITKKIIHEHEVFLIDEDALVACFDNNGKITEEFVKELTQYSPLRVVFRDAGFASDSVKINVAQIFKQLSPHTEVKTI